MTSPKRASLSHCERRALPREQFAGEQSHGQHGHPLPKHGLQVPRPSSWEVPPSRALAPTHQPTAVRFGGSFRTAFHCLELPKSVTFRYMFKIQNSFRRISDAAVRPRLLLPSCCVPRAWLTGRAVRFHSDMAVAGPVSHSVYGMGVAKASPPDFSALSKPAVTVDVGRLQTELRALHGRLEMLEATALAAVSYTHLTLPTKA